MNVTQHSLQIWTIDDLLSPYHCAQMIEFCERLGFEEATVSLRDGPQMMKGLRDNYRVRFEDKPLAKKLFKGLKDHIPTLENNARPLELYDQFRVYRYENSQRFKRHIDGRVWTIDGESRLTFMVYLNDDFSGGETKFDDVVITPKEGSALLFIHEQKHEGVPVSDGLKYVLRSDVIYE